MRLISKAVSFIFHPLFMPTFGIALALYFTYLWVLPPKMKLAIIFLVFSISCLFPVAAILFLMRMGIVKNAEITDRRERALPYIINIVAILLCSFVFYKVRLPIWIIYVFLASGASLVVALVVNFYWKISAHALGVGALLGGVMAFAKISFTNMYLAFICLFVIAGAVSTSRVYLGRHTPMQVYAGFLLGLLCTFSVSFLRHNIIFTN